MVSMAIMVASFRQSLDDWLAQVLPADLYVRSGAAGDSAHFNADEQRRFAAVPGVRRIDFLRAQSLLLDPSLPRVVLIARDLPADDPARALPLVEEAPAIAGDGDPPTVWISEAIVDLYGFKPGQRITLPIDGRALPFFVGGRLARLRAPAGRDRAGPRGLRAPHRRHDGERRRAVALPTTRTSPTCGTNSTSVFGSGRLDVRHAGRHPRNLARRIRPHVRGDLRAGGGRGRHRPRRPVVVVRRAGVRAAARIRHAAARRHDAAADRGDAGARKDWWSAASDCVAGLALGGS